jgi:pyruvate ferredoxin oxidoreductase gamma subunit
MDDSLLKEAPEQVFHGVFAHTPLFVNADPDQVTAHTNDLPPANYIFIDLSAIARELIGSAFVSAAAAAVAARSIPAIDIEALNEAVKIEIAEFGLPADIIGRNQAAARRAYAQAPIVPVSPASTAMEVLETAWQAVPYLGSAQFAGPTIRHRGSAALRATGNWRTERPEIELGKCKRCFLCYLYCPEAAMTLDAENFPHVDYDHCKGCMICFEECPTDAISRRLEA